MRLFVASEQRYLSWQGKLFAPGSMGYQFYQRYLDVFDEVVVVARSRPAEEPPEGWVRVDGDRIAFAPMPYYVGPREFASAFPALMVALIDVARRDGAFLLRVPGTVGTLLWACLVIFRKAFALEVVGDPYESLSPRIWKRQGIRLARWLATASLKKQCRSARLGVAYVTQRVLQERYPASASSNNRGLATGIRVFGVSDVDLGGLERQSSDIIRVSAVNGRPWCLVFVGSLATLCKGPDVLLRAVALCLKERVAIHLVILGDGCHRRMLENLAITLGIAESVHFLGHLADSGEVHRALRQADLFVLPSHTEGLPRAMLEAMAVGLPCIGTYAGGIPELLPSEDLVPGGDHQALARKIREVLADPVRMREMSRRNREVAWQYREEALRERRVEFYRCVRAGAESHAARSR